MLAYERPERVVLTWNSTCDPGSTAVSVTEVEVRFTPESATHTRVDLEHRGFEVYADRAAENRERYESDGAWTFVLGRFGAYFS